MREVLFIILGAVLCGIAFLMLKILGDYAGRFGQWLGFFGFGGGAISVAYFGSLFNEHLFFGYAGAYLAIVLILFFANICLGLIYFARYVMMRREEGEAKR